MKALYMTLTKLLFKVQVAKSTPQVLNTLYLTTIQQSFFKLIIKCSQLFGAIGSNSITSQEEFRLGPCCHLVCILVAGL